MSARMEKKDVIIVGGGPAGLAAAVKLYELGIRDILIVEREKQLGGILRQCIHDGFGLTRFKTTLSGPEYAARFIRQVEMLQIPYVTDTTVLEVSEDKVVTAASKDGLEQWQAKCVILTMGCRERTRGALGIPGERPAGVFTAGVAQASAAHLGDRHAAGRNDRHNDEGGLIPHAAGRVFIHLDAGDARKVHHVPRPGHNIGQGGGFGIGHTAQIDRHEQRAHLVIGNFAGDIAFDRKGDLGFGQNAAVPFFGNNVVHSHESHLRNSERPPRGLKHRQAAARVLCCES